MTPYSAGHKEGRCGRERLGAPTLGGAGASCSTLPRLSQPGSVERLVDAAEKLGRELEVRRTSSVRPVDA